MVQVLEAVPNFSEGRDLAKIGALVDAISAVGVDVLDWSADPDHHRSVVTYIGDPSGVEAASIAAARFARDHISLEGHDGVHPRVGALDVMPMVPLVGLDMADAVASARRVGAGIAALGVPVYWYGAASDPPGRGLASLRRGGFEALLAGFPADRRPDAPVGAIRPHPTAGVTCVGARRILLAWNVFVGGVDAAEARGIASKIRERDGGFPGLRALGLELGRRQAVQVSMNLEDPDRTSPRDVYDTIRRLVEGQGGEVLETQVIGMMPDALVYPPSGGRLETLDHDSRRVLSRRVAEHIQARSRSLGTQTSDDPL